MEETIRKFEESGEYAQVPTEAEKREVEKELKEVKEAELGIKDPTESSEEKESVENAQEKESAEAKEAAAATSGADPVKEEVLAEHAKETASHKAVEKEHVLLKERRITRAQVEATPEALKVKRARAQAAYKGSQIEIPDRVVDVKVK